MQAATAHGINATFGPFRKYFKISRQALSPHRLPIYALHQSRHLWQLCQSCPAKSFVEAAVCLEAIKRLNKINQRLLLAGALSLMASQDCEAAPPVPALNGGKPSYPHASRQRRRTIAPLRHQEIVSCASIIIFATGCKALCNYFFALPLPSSFRRCNKAATWHTSLGSCGKLRKRSGRVSCIGHALRVDFGIRR